MWAFDYNGFDSLLTIFRLCSLTHRKTRISYNLLGITTFSQTRMNMLGALLFHSVTMPSEWEHTSDNVNITLRPRQICRLFADDIFECVFKNENVWILLSLKFAPRFPMYNIPALVLIVAWRRQGDKPLSEPMVASSLTPICVTRWVSARNTLLHRCGLENYEKVFQKIEWILYTLSTEYNKR